MACAAPPCPAPYFQGFRQCWKSKLGVSNFSLSPNAFFFQPLRFSAPWPLVLCLFFVRVLERRPWNPELGSPPSTLSCHLSLKEENEDEYAATSAQGRKKVCEEGQVGDKERSRHYPTWTVLRPWAPGWGSLGSLSRGLVAWGHLGFPSGAPCLRQRNCKWVSSRVHCPLAQRQKTVVFQESGVCLEEPPLLRPFLPFRAL